jgi:hypothetical protein
MTLSYGDMKISTVVVMRPYFAIEVVYKLGWRLARFCHEVKKIKASQYGIPLRDMPAEAIPTAFLPTDDSVLVHHQGSHIFETDWGLINRHVEELAQTRKHHGGSKCPDHGTPFTADFQEIQTKQGKDLVLGQELSLFVYDADTVGVSIGG